MKEKNIGPDKLDFGFSKDLKPDIKSDRLQNAQQRLQDSDERMHDGDHSQQLYDWIKNEKNQLKKDDHDSQYHG